MRSNHTLVERRHVELRMGREDRHSRAENHPLNCECEKRRLARGRRSHHYHSQINSIHHRQHRIWFRLPSRTIMLIYFVSMAKSTSSIDVVQNFELDNSELQCTVPIVVNAIMEHLPRIAHDNNYHLGDGILSTQASGIFFDSIDRDGDGAIEPEEVALFLQNEIGGKQFDTQLEVDEEVGTIMERLDQNHNNGLEMSDMLSYWAKMESLLTAEEVADWIVYSVQLPRNVGKIFLENGITGYDFLEIVDNRGEVLLHELGIDKQSFRNKIIRGMQARMLGIGSPPETPQIFSFKLESCKAVTLTWERSSGTIFPVHSYRIQRRGVNLFGAENTHINDFSTMNSDALNVSPVLNSYSEWKTVYVGGDDEFADSGLETGHNYMYRIQAWNSIGRSGWETIDLSRALKKQRCSTTPPSQPTLVSDRGTQSSVDIEHHLEWMAVPKRLTWGIVAVVQFIYHSFRFFFALTAMLAGLMRYRRATATSSASAMTTLPFPRFWKAINYLSMSIIGQEYIPKTMLGDEDALMRQEQLHDERINATGLRGYNQIREKRRNRDDLADKQLALKKVGFSAADLTTPATALKEVSILSKKFTWMRSLSKGSGATSFRSLASEVSDLSSSRSCGMSRNSSHLDDDNRCSECQKKFKIGRRYKHHCARCMAVFCHKDGRTTHNNFSSCKVPGDCICNTCLRIVASNGLLSEGTG